MKNIELLENEYFIPLKGFEKTYQISNLGRIYSNYTKSLYKSVKDKDRYILSFGGNKQKKLHIYDMYLNTFGENLYKWYTENINKAKIDNLESEVWKPIKEYEGYYQVSNFGRIKSCIRNTRTWKIRKESLISPKKCSKIPYFQVRLSKNNVNRFYFIHRLVAQEFIDNFNNYPIVNHIDNNPQNNNIYNLEWCTQSMNIKHCIKQGRNKNKENSRKSSKINFEIAEEIRKFAKENRHLSQREISLKFKVSREIVKDIINYKSWKIK